MRKTISLVLIAAVFNAGCAGRQANPIAAYLPGDENRSCPALKAEVAQLQVDMQRLLAKTDKGLTNALWATAGVFFIVPFFFMDFKDAEKIEFDAMRKRHNRLLVYAAEKDCDFGEVTAERIPSIKERKEAAKKAKKETEATKESGDSIAVSKDKYEEYQQYLAEKEKNKLQESTPEND
jgi:hypothetical protein